MLVVVPSAVAQVDTTKIGYTLIHNHQFLMVRPHDCEKLIRLIYMIRVAQYFDVLMRQGQDPLRVGAVYGQGYLNLFINKHVDLDTLLGLTLQKLVQAPLVSDHDRPLQIDLRAQEEPGYEYLLLGGLDRIGHRLHVVRAVDEPSYVVVFSARRERVEALLVTEEAARAFDHFHDGHAPLQGTLLVVALDEYRLGEVLDEEAMPLAGGLVATGDIERMVN